VELKGKKVLVLGLGESGLSMAKWLTRRGAVVRVADSRTNPPGVDTLRAALPAVELHLGGWRDDDFADADFIAISPGVPRETPQVVKAAAAGKPVIGDVELFARTLSIQNRPKIIAITGTNGKTTVTSLTGAMCRAAGLDCEVAGNISPAVLDALSAREASGKAAAAWVLELSSFQLESTYSLEADAATMLNLTEDHLDRHGSMREYGLAKERIFQGQGAQVLNRDDPASLAMARPGRSIITFGTGAPVGKHEFGLVNDGGRLWLAQGGSRLLATDQMQLAGLHNAANALAALALCRAIGLPFEPLLGALRAFRGLPHRVEFVAEIAGVRYYDDSKGTNVGSTVAALAGLSGTLQHGAKVVLIAGGEGKGQDFSPLEAALAHCARALVLIGRDAALIERAAAGSGVSILHAASMREAVQQAAAQARAGDAVLLSPACASFDMFRDYKHRGEVFTSVVRERAHA
jgi:UDP-N-acetylmuramoylalanine--D-glutamate ligase